MYHSLVHNKPQVRFKSTYNFGWYLSQSSIIKWRTCFSKCSVFTDILKLPFFLSPPPLADSSSNPPLLTWCNVMNWHRRPDLTSWHFQMYRITNFSLYEYEQEESFEVFKGVRWIYGIIEWLWCYIRLFWAGEIFVIASVAYTRKSLLIYI